MITAADALSVLFIGNFSTRAPPEGLIIAFRDLLRFAVDAGKLQENFKLHRESNIIAKDKLDEVLSSPPFDKHFDWHQLPAKQIIF